VSAVLSPETWPGVPENYSNNILTIF